LKFGGVGDVEIPPNWLLVEKSKEQKTSDHSNESQPKQERQVSFHDDFAPEFDALAEDVQDEMLAHAKLLEQFGPQLGRPRVDTLNGSRHAHKKELRFDAADGFWRVAFAFDPQRQVVLLVAGDKSGGSEKRYYRQLIAKADERFDDHLSRLKKDRRK
jgi:hypothetical protein